eukprot:m.72419 g.72419  ORF g.72419 m.72419 type:complete len:310 (+) comp11737_c0_seq6:809-1738(+)
MACKRRIQFIEWRRKWSNEIIYSCICICSKQTRKGHWYHPLFIIKHRNTRDNGVEGRNVINILTSDIVICLPGGPGTRSELEMALKYNRPVCIYTGREGKTIAAASHLMVPRFQELRDVQKFVIGCTEQLLLQRRSAVTELEGSNGELHPPSSSHTSGNISEKSTTDGSESLGNQHMSTSDLSPQKEEDSTSLVDNDDIPKSKHTEGKTMPDDMTEATNPNIDENDNNKNSSNSGIDNDIDIASTQFEMKKKPAQKTTSSSNKKKMKRRKKKEKGIGSKATTVVDSPDLHELHDAMQNSGSDESEAEGL